jgi:hypothetical protein
LRRAWAIDGQKIAIQAHLGPAARFSRAFSSRLRSIGYTAAKISPTARASPTMDNLRYTLSLRIWHPRLSAAEIIRRLRLEPWVSYSRGEPRVLVNGHKMSGTWPRSYCCFRIRVPTNVGPEALIAKHLGSMVRHRRFFAAIRRAGGETEYYLSCASSGAVGLALEPALLERLGRMHIRLGIDGFVSIREGT